MINREEAKQLMLHYWEYLERLAHKRFPADSNAALEALDYAWNKFQADDWLFVRKHAGAGFTAFLTKTVQNLFTDYARKIGGTKQTPKWISERGDFWVEAWRMLCLQGLNRHETKETLLAYAEQLGKEAFYVDEVLDAILQKEKPLPDNRTVSLPKESGAEEEQNNQWKADGSDIGFITRSTEEELEDMQNSVLLQNIFMLLNCLLPNQSDSKYEEAVEMWLKKLRNTLVLKDEEYVLLTMIHEDGLKVVEAGRRLGLNANQVSARYRRLLDRIKNAFKECGLEDDMKNLLELES
ncbi:MAG: hypothetical protein GY862_29390 [Gammaproteobacteria bacterium]|nr:hypothetical protein [Gammaproteobacteria bacterium]